MFWFVGVFLCLLGGGVLGFFELVGCYVFVYLFGILDVVVYGDVYVVGE